jgi:hypothetical protein
MFKKKSVADKKGEITPIKKQESASRLEVVGPSLPNPSPPMQNSTSGQRKNRTSVELAPPTSFLGESSFEEFSVDADDTPRKKDVFFNDHRVDSCFNSYRNLHGWCFSNVAVGWVSLFLIFVDLYPYAFSNNQMIDPLEWATVVYFWVTFDPSVMFVIFVFSLHRWNLFLQFPWQKISGPTLVIRGFFWISL